MEVGPDRQESDAMLVARFLQGDESSFDGLVVRHRLGVYRLAYRLLGSHEEADDVAQEAFLRAYRGLPGFRGDATFRTWITRIVINLALSVRRERASLVPLKDAPEMRRQADGPETALRGQVRRAVGGLPPRQRQVLILKVYEGMKFTEIAEAAGMSVGTAKATFFQAVRKLRARLAPPAGAQGEEV